MDAAADRPEFEPPQEHGLRRGFAFAVLAHVLLALGLTQAVQWQRVSHEAAVEAELWSSLPRQAAPREVEAPPPPPAPAPVVRAPPEPEPPVQREAEIALEREKQRLEAERRRQEELERQRAEQRRQEELERQRAEQRRLEAAKKKREEELARKKREEEQAKLLAEAKRKEEERKRQEQEAREAKRLAELRDENLRRIQGMAGTGAPSSTGTAAQSTGPSAGWGARVQARVRPNIVFTDHINGNPRAEVEVRSAPDGTIIARRLVRSSGVKAWDEAVLRALDKTESLPRDVDGRVPSPVVIEFKPKG